MIVIPKSTCIARFTQASPYPRLLGYPSSMREGHNTALPFLRQIWQWGGCDDSSLVVDKCLAIDAKKVINDAEEQLCLEKCHMVLQWYSMEITPTKFLIAESARCRDICKAAAIELVFAVVWHYEWRIPGVRRV